MKLRIKELLREKNMTAVSLAEKIEITQPNMSRIINGKIAPSLDTLEKISQALEIPITELFDVGEYSEPTRVTIMCPHCNKPIEIIAKQKDI